jgi:hypothetical protein
MPHCRQGDCWGANPWKAWGHWPRTGNGKILPLADTIGAPWLAFPTCQVGDAGLPLMVPAAFVNAAWAAQPDLLTARMGEISRRFAPVAGGVPHALYDLAVRGCQSFLSLNVEPWSCNTQAVSVPLIDETSCNLAHSPSCNKINQEQDRHSQQRNREILEAKHTKVILRGSPV